MKHTKELQSKGVGKMTEKCWRCRGDGYFYTVPSGFNPFLAGAIQTAAASRRVECWTCDGTGRAALKAGEK